MRRSCSVHFTLLALAPVLAAFAGYATLDAQHIATATIKGRVRGEQQEDVVGALVRVTNSATGYAIQTTTTGGGFAVLGLPVGGPYLVVVERIGYRPARRDSIFLALGDRLQADFTLVPLAILLDTLRIIVPEAPLLAHARIGTATMISDSALHRLPTIDRDLYDFVRLAPQALVRLGEVGISGGGVSVRFNSFLLDGVSERGPLGNFAAGTGQGAKAIPIEAVKEYQILFSPYDTRYGDFAGTLVNAVTRSGTNEMRGTAFVYGRNEQLARGTPFLSGSPYERFQFGFTLGGPIKRDRAHFFLAPELQRLNAPAGGPYLGQSSGSEEPVPVFESDVRRFAALLQQRGLHPGSSGRVEIGNPLVNLFARVDVAWPERNSRLVLWNNYSHAKNIVFSRRQSTSALTAGSLAFPLSSAGYTATVSKEVVAGQLYTHMRNGGLNEALIAFRVQPSRMVPNERAPSISVMVPRADTTGGTVWLEAGSHVAAHGISVSQTTLEIADHLTLSLGAKHALGLGARVEFFQLEGRGRPGTYGSWLFLNLDSLERGAADRYRIVREGNRPRPLGAQYSFYLSDEWRVTEQASIVAGVRVDVVAMGGRPAYNAAVDSLYGRRTSEVLQARPHWSPRVGFNWELTRGGRARLRGGTGVFVGRPPTGWLAQPFSSNGNSIVTLLCGRGSTVVGPAPRFVSDYRNQPNTCSNDIGVREGPVNLADPDLRMAKALRASLAYDQLLPWRVLATLEGLYTKQLNDFVFVNLNLAGAHASDRHGRVLYGDFDASTADLISNRFSEVIDLRNHSKSYSYQGAVRLEKRFSDQLEASASYAYSRAYDVQTAPSNFAALDNWRSGRVVSGLHETIRADRSLLDSPHHVVLAATYRAPWQRWVTDLSVYYVGQSGSPFTYRSTGDLNDDGTNLNDPIYIPRMASDTSEIRFGGTADVAADQAQFEDFIERTACLRRQRSRIMARNSCRAPWVHISNASVRQTLPALGGHALTMQLDVFNVLNLLNDDWGLFRELTSANPALLSQVGRTPGTASTSQPIFRFEPDRGRFNSENVESAYQLQLALRYSF